MSETEADSAAIERAEDLGAPPRADARYWISQLNLASKGEEKWRQRAKKVLKLYSDEERANEQSNRTRAIKFNILYSNVETLKGALLPAIPKPDVRQRWRDKDPAATTAAKILERTVGTLLEQCDFAHIAQSAVLDRCLPGRAVVRIDYDLETDDDEEGKPKRIALQSVTCRQVQWDDFRRGPGRTWEEVSWVAYKHRLRRDQMVEMFGKKIGDMLPLNLAPEEKDLPKDADPNLWKRGEVWEIHDRDKRQVIWVCTDWQDAPCKVEPDKLGLQGFFNTPRPLLAIERPDSQEPVEEYRMYEDQARELEKVTRRIDKIISGLKVRGIAASVIPEFSKVASADDNALVMAQSDASQAALASGKMADAVWMWPLETAIKALQELYIQRDAIKQTIYEINGIGDILRGSVDPREKLGQSQLKASWGSRRLDTAREDVTRYLRDLIRIMAEIVAEHFDPQQLMMISGIQLAPRAMHQQAAMAQQGQAPGQPPPQLPPQVQALLKAPPLEDVIGVLRSDAMRTFRVDVETDASLVGDEAQEKKDVTDFLTGTVQFWSGMAPLVQGGFPKEVAAGIYTAAAKRFKFGRDVEEYLDDLAQAPVPPPPAAAEGSADTGAAAQATAAAQVKAKQAETEAKLASMQADQAGRDAEHRRNIELKDKDLAIRNIDLQIAALNARVKIGEMMKPPESPEPPEEDDPMDGELKAADLEMKRAQTDKIRAETKARSRELS